MVVIVLNINNSNADRTAFVAAKTKCRNFMRGRMSIFISSQSLVNLFSC